MPKIANLFFLCFA